MKFYQSWTARVLEGGNPDEKFPAQVPGNLQDDYAKFHNWGDVNYGTNVLKYKDTEEFTWQYEAELNFDLKDDERLYFVSHGIDYFSAVAINGVEVCRHEGCFSNVEADITDYLKEKNILTVTVFPHPKRRDQGVRVGTRDEADTSVKPPVSYGWDWHPRLIVSGMFDETYLEARKADHILDWEYNYEISDDFTSAEVEFKVDCNATPKVELFDQEGNCVYSGDGSKFTLNNVNLWWCNGHGDPYLYKYRISTASDVKEGKLGFKKIELVMNEGEWNFPNHFPKGRANAPITICLNGKRIFGKGTNYTTPEIFTGLVTWERYRDQVLSMKNANMNLLRLWGGCGMQKEQFYELCDEHGLMVWQEFPLACNEYGRYGDTKHYLKVLEQEGRSIVKRVRKHPCLVLLCGGNELFNSWSHMTDQSLPLRQLNAISYRNAPEIPFLMTSPITGMVHGPYTMLVGSVKDNDGDCFQVFQRSKATAYTEFGNPSVAPVEYIKTVMSEEDMKEITVDPNGPWALHHSFEGIAPVDRVPGCKPMNYDFIKFRLDNSTLESLNKNSEWLQCQGFRAIYEEARRQWPTCSMAVNWFYEEPWKAIRGNSIVLYPNIKKPAYYTIKDSLRPRLFSARIPKFDWYVGERFSAELWFLNDTGLDCEGDTVTATLILGDESFELATWTCESGIYNFIGPTVHKCLPHTSEDYFILKLTSKSGQYDNEYKLRIYPSRPKPKADVKLAELNGNME